MKKLFKKARAKIELELFSRRLVDIRNALGETDPDSSDIARQHTRLAEELFDEALAAMKYNNPAQALDIINEASVHLDIAAVLARRTILGKLPNIPDEAEDQIRYLSSALARTKALIEYSNCLVSPFARTVLDSAMDYYNLAMERLREESPRMAIHAAHAGLLKAALAGEMIAAENQRTLPAWTALSNPMLGNPLRHTRELHGSIVEVRVLLNSLNVPDTRFRDLMKDYDSALRSLAADNHAHAQMLVRKLLQEAAEIKTEIGRQLDEHKETQLDPGEISILTQSGHIDLLLSELESAISATGATSRSAAGALVQSISFHFADALAAARRDDLSIAERELATALFNLDLLRQKLFPESDFPR